MTTDIYALYQQHYATPSDIQHHLGLLYSLAHGNVLELGTRGGVSTAALLAGVERSGGHVWSIDIDPNCALVFIAQLTAAQAETTVQLWTFIHGNSTDPDLTASKTGGDPFDLLLIDTDHTWEQASAELALWGPHVARGGTIAMHDPETFPGVRRAAQEFADAHGWPITFVLPCNGMAIIRRPE